MGCPLAWVLVCSNSNAKYSKYSASLIQSQRIEESTVKEITFYKFGRLVSVFINISIKAFHPSTTDLYAIFQMIIYQRII